MGEAQVWSLDGKRLAIAGRTAVVDMGAGAFHLTVEDRRYFSEASCREERPVQMLEPLRSGRIDDASWGVGLGALRALVGRATADPETSVVGVASSWFGELDNGREFLAEARGATGLPFELLSGEQAATLVWSAAKASAPWARGLVGVLAIGASCVQLAVGLGAMPVLAQSLPLGALRLRARRLGADGYLDASAAKQISQEVLEVAEHAAKRFRSFRPTCLLLAGGTVRALARARNLLDEGVHGASLTRRDALELAALLSGNGSEHYVASGAERPNPGTLGVAALVLASLLTLLDTDGGTVVRAGLRQGVLLRERGVIDGRGPSDR